MKRKMKCSSCSLNKDKSEFVDKSLKSEYSRTCKSCRALRAKLRYQEKKLSKCKRDDKCLVRVDILDKNDMKRINDMLEQITKHKIRVQNVREKNKKEEEKKVAYKQKIQKLLKKTKKKNKKK